MNGVMLVKVTLNEIADPDLYAHIMRFDNPRLRAGALRALARAALLNERLTSSAASTHAMEQPSVPVHRQTSTFSVRSESANDVRDALPIRHEPTLTDTREIAAPTIEPAKPANGRRFDTDAIGDQFAQF
jgi:hypothetical protein